MAYGDNRSQVASDDFGDASLHANWANGQGDYSDITETGGVAQPSTTAADCAIKRTGDTFGDDQYSTVTVGAFADTGDNWLASCVRMQDSTTDESAYVGYATTNGDEFNLYEVDASWNWNSIASTSGAGDIPLASGETVTLEAEGTTLRLGAAHGGGGDAQELSTTDNTISSGYPGLNIYEASSVTNTTITAWAGGNIVAVEITDVNTTESWNDGDTGLVITGTGFC